MGHMRTVLSSGGRDWSRQRLAFQATPASPSADLANARRPADEPRRFLPRNDQTERMNSISQDNPGSVLPKRTRQLRVLLVETTEWLQVGLRRAAEVLGLVDRLRVFHADDIGRDEPIDLIVFEQRTPAELSSDVYERWRHRFPLARVVTVWGPWCLGGGRNGFPVSGESYVNLVVWPWQVQCFLRQWFSDQATLWDVPRTSSPTERLARGTNAVESKPAWGPEAIDLICSDPAMEEALSMACETLGWSVERFPAVAARESDTRKRGQPEKGAGRLWIWEPAPNPTDTSPDQLLAASPSGSGIMLLGFAELTGRWANDSTARRLFLPKPFLLAELQAAVRDLCF